MYAIAGIVVRDADAAVLVSSTRAALPATAGEPKYTTLANSAAGRDALVDALASLPPGAARAYLAHKRYMVAAKMVDLLVEPMFDDARHDMYFDGSAPALANLLHLAGPVTGDAAAFDAMLAAFIAAVRGRATATLDELYAAIDAYVATCSPEWRGIVGLLAASRAVAHDLRRLVATGSLRDSLDPAVPCLVALCRDIGERVGAFRLVHDASNVLARHALELLRLDRLPDPMRPGRRLDALPAVEIDFVDSARAPQLQIADWAAGATRQWATSLLAGRASDPLAQRLEPIVHPWLIGGLWPDPDAIGGTGPGE